MPLSGVGVLVSVGVAWVDFLACSFVDCCPEPTTLPRVVPGSSPPPVYDDTDRPVTASTAVMPAMPGDHHGEAGERDLAPGEVPAARRGLFVDGWWSA